MGEGRRKEGGRGKEGKGELVGGPMVQWSRCNRELHLISLIPKRTK